MMSLWNGVRGCKLVMEGYSGVRCYVGVVMGEGGIVVEEKWDRFYIYV